MQRTRIRLATVAGLAVVALGATATSALAHEERTVGKYHVEVGFGTEPAYVGYPNSVQLLLNDAHDNPVTNLGDTLKVVVIQGSQHKKLSVVPNFEVGGDGIPGDYRAWFIPTTAGVYTFHFTGTVKGQKFDQKFTSSPTTFDEVQDPATVEFPQQPPTTGELAQRLDRELPRLATVAYAKQTHDDLSQVRVLAIVGIALGAVGLVIGGLALRRKSG